MENLPSSLAPAAVAATLSLATAMTPNFTSGETVSGTVVVSNETADSSWTIARGGELRLEATVGEPLVRWTFDNAAQPGADTGSLGKNFDIAACMTATNDTERGRCLYFDGTGHKWAGYATGLPSNTAFTIAAWMKSEYENSGLLYWGANSAVKSAGFGLQDGKPTFYFYGGGDLQAPASATYYDGETWTHFAAVFDPDAASGQKMRIYVNGVQTAAMDPTRTVAIDTTSDLRFGICTLKEQRYNKGFVDEVMIVGRALTDVEIASIGAPRDFLPLAASVSVAEGGVMSIGIDSQTFGGMSGNGTLQIDDVSEARFASNGLQSIGEIEGAGSAVVASGALEIGLDGSFVAHTVLHYTFDDSSDPGVDTGSAGLSLKASTATGDATWADMTSGAVPGAMYFDGSHCLVPTAAAAGNVSRIPSGNSAYTIIVRLTLDEAGGRDGISSWGYNSRLQKNGLRFYNASENLSSTFGLMSYQWGADTPASLDGMAASLPGAPVDGWHTVVVTYDPTTSAKAFYLDGALVASATLSAALNVAADRFTIGRSEGNGYDYYRGYIDDYRVLDCAVTAEQARALVAEVPTAAKATAFAVNDSATLSVPSGMACTAGTIDAAGTVSVDGRLNVTAGESEISGTLTGVGVVATSFGAKISISGEKAFAGTVKVENGALSGAWSLPSVTVTLGGGGVLVAEDAGVCSAGGISLADGCIADLGTLAPGGAYWTSSTPIALPETFTVRVTAAAHGSETRTIFAAPSVSGSVASWILEATGFSEEQAPELRMTDNGVELFVKSPAFVIVVR